MHIVIIIIIIITIIIIIIIIIVIIIIILSQRVGNGQVPYRDQSIYLHSKSIAWFLYYAGLCGRELPNRL